MRSYADVTLAFRCARGGARVRRRPNQHSHRVLWASLVASAAIHLVLTGPLKSSIEQYLSRSSTQPPPVKVVQLSAEQWSQNLRTKADPKRQERQASPALPALAHSADTPKAELPPQEPEKKKEEKARGQVVEVPPTADDRPNPDAKLLSKHNTTVEKETIARAEERDRNLKRVTNKLQTSGDKKQEKAGVVSPQLSVKGDGLNDTREAKQEEQRMVLKVPDILKRQEIDLRLDPRKGDSVLNRSRSEALRGNSDRLELQLGSSSEEARGEAGGTKGSPNGADQKGLPTISALMPNMGTLARISGSPSPDHVDGVEQGDGTFLNTREFKYATFFYRVRDSVYDHWVSAADREFRRRDPTGNIYGIGDRATLLSIELDASGELDHVRIERASGVEFLDAVAVEAFKKAQPFPNPPSGMVEEDGRIRFNFQFIVTRPRGSNLFR